MSKSIVDQNLLPGVKNFWKIFSPKQPTILMTQFTSCKENYWII